MNILDYEQDAKDVFEWITATDKGMIEKSKVLDGKKYYGTNNKLMVKFLLQRGTVPNICEQNDDELIYYFECTNDFNNVKQFYKKMSTGYMLPWMIKMAEETGDSF